MSPKPSAKPSVTIVLDDRCKYVAASGRCCRANVARDTSRASGYSAFCLPHSQMEQQFLDSKSVAKDLIGPIDDFRTHMSVSEVLGKLLVLVAENRIPLRNAATIAYICQLLTTSNSGVRYEVNLIGGKEGELHVINRTMDMMYGALDDEKDQQHKENNKAAAEKGEKDDHAITNAAKILQGLQQN
jgi:hypothetical protein